MSGKNKRPTQSKAKKGHSAKSGERRNARGPKARAAEVTSGSQRSSLDPDRKKLILQGDKTSEAAKGRLSGDVQNLSQEELSDSESVEELVEEGQDLEGELIQGIEDAPPADQGEVRTHAPSEPNDGTPDYKNRNRL